MVRKIVSIIALLTLLMMSDAKAMQKQQAQEQQPIKKIVFLTNIDRVDGHGLDDMGRVALERFMQQVFINQQIHSEFVNMVTASDEEVRDRLKDCSAAIYYQCPDILIRRALLTLITQNHEPLCDEHGVYHFGLPGCDDRELERVRDGAINHLIMIRKFEATAQRLNRLLGDIPNDRKAFLNMWLKTDEQASGYAPMDDVLRGGHAVELCPITGAMGNQMLDLWFEHRIKGFTISQRPPALDDLCREFTGWLQNALRQEPVRIAMTEAEKEERLELVQRLRTAKDQQLKETMEQERKEYERRLQQDREKIAQLFFHGDQPQQQQIPDSQERNKVAQEQQQPANQLQLPDPVQQRIDDPQPNDANDMIFLPHLVPAEQPAVDHPGLISRCINWLRLMYWPQINLPTINRNRQVERANLHHSLITEVDTNWVEREKVLNAIAARALSCGAFGALAILSRSLIKHWSYKKTIPATLAAGLFSFLGCAIFSSGYLWIFDHHALSINWVRHVDLAHANRLKVHYGDRPTRERERANHFIDLMTDVRQSVR